MSSTCLQSTVLTIALYKSAFRILQSTGSSLELKKTPQTRSSLSNNQNLYLSTKPPPHGFKHRLYLALAAIVDHVLISGGFCEVFVKYCIKNKKNKNNNHTNNTKPQANHRCLKTRVCVTIAHQLWSSCSTANQLTTYFISFSLSMGC